jgi:hypothetical protein
MRNSWDDCRFIKELKAKNEKTNIHFSLDKLDDSWDNTRFIKELKAKNEKDDIHFPISSQDLHNFWE